MDDTEIQKLTCGVPVKITSWDSSTHQLHAIDSSGRVYFCVSPTSDSSCEGRTAILDRENNQIVFDDHALFSEQTEILVIREVRDHSFLADRGLEVVWKAYPGDIDLKPGNTVKYGLLTQQIEVLSDSPIRSNGLLDTEASPAQFKQKNTRRLTYEDFSGSEALVAEVKTLFETQLDAGKRALLKRIGVEPLKGVLFSGPPGTGKTLLARIIASVTGAAFYLVNGPEILDKFVGSTEKVLRNIFTAASDEKDGAIIFFDEIDTLASQRGENNQLPGQGQLVGQLLTLMDGFEQNKKVIVIGATNRASDLDRALRRPGRFDRMVEFSLPSAKERKQILEMSMEKKSTIGSMPIDFIVSKTEGFSPAELTLIWDEAGLISASESRASICPEDILRGYYQVDTQHKYQMEVNSK